MLADVAAGGAVEARQKNPRVVAGMKSISNREDTDFGREAT
jgi:hypothetical protein